MDWIAHHWERVLVIAGVLVGVWNGLIAFLKVMGYPQLAAWCQKLEDALSAAVKAFIDSKKATTASLLMFGLLIGSNAFADIVIPNAKSGVIYDFKTNQSLAVNTVKVYSYKMLDLNAGALRTDGLAATLSVDVSSLKFDWLKLPVLDMVNYLNLGYGIGIEDISSDKHYVNGPYASISWKF